MQGFKNEDPPRPLFQELLAEALAELPNPESEARDLLVALVDCRPQVSQRFHAAVAEPLLRLVRD